MKDRTQLLIDILFDKTAREDERHDAAMDLGDYKDVRALEALVKIAADPTEDNSVVDGSAESIGEICVGMNYFNEDLFRKLTPFAQMILFNYIIIHNPMLFTESFKEEFKHYNRFEQK